MDEQLKLALLVDAENVSAKYIKLIMDEISAYGAATHKRVYGNFGTPSVEAWKNNLRDYAMTPVFQFNYTQGKNASDSAMVIDAMDILYSGKVDGFCLVTSDSDFTKLAIRLREAGMLVIGMGEKKTPNSLVTSCEQFKFLDLLYNNKAMGTEDGEKPMEQKARVEIPQEDSRVLTGSPHIGHKNEDGEGEESAGESIPDKEKIKLEIESIIDSRIDETEWMNLATLGGILVKRIPGFDPRNYGCKKLAEFVDSFGYFDTQEVENPKNKLLKIVYIKNR